MRKPRTKRQTRPAWMTDDEAILWPRYLADRSEANRNALVELYIPFLKSQALRTKKLLHDVSECDLGQDGLFGLIHAIENFDLHRNIRFTTYATSRIRGAMLDSLRLLDHLPRGTRTRGALWDKTAAELETKIGMSPTVSEIKDALDLPEETKERAREDAADCRVSNISLSTDRFHVRDCYGDNKTPTVENDLHARLDREPSGHAELQEWWQTMLRPLDIPDRSIVVLYYVFGWTMKRIGLHLGLSESRVSQRHDQAMKLLAKSSHMPALADIPNIGGECWRLIDVLPHCRKIRRKFIKHKSMRLGRPRKAGAA